jgi:hypothetical protein
MRSVGRRVCIGLVAAALMLFALQAAPSLASGPSSSGEISRAQVSPDWTMASIAGVASRTNECVEPPEEPEPPEGPEPGESSGPTPPIEPESPPQMCGWIPYATVGPGTSQADCSSAGRRLDSLGQGVQLVWEGKEIGGPGSAGYDLQDVQLENGPNGPLLCLSAVEAVVESLMCEVEEEGGTCPYVVEHAYYQLDSALLEPATPSVSPATTSALSSPVQPFAYPGRVHYCRTVNPRSKGKGPSTRAKSGRHASKRKPFKLCLDRLTRVG